jgi:hypothetical protein
MVDRLIGGAEFIEFWTNKWCDLLQVNQKFLGGGGARAFRDWIRGAVASNMPYDEFAYKILNASGAIAENPAASYFKIIKEPDLVMENTTQLFLGIRFNCNKCHDHPFERWTQSNHWQLAAYFARVGVKDENGREIVVDKTDGEVVAPYSGLTVAPAFPFRHEGEVPEEVSRREQLARWVTSEKNGYFVKSYVNRLWSYLLGVGLIEPVDDIRAGNPPTNPELLDYLAQEFLASGFDTRNILRLICKSRTYQHAIDSTPWNEDDSINYSHAIARRLPAETLYDAIHLVTGTPIQLPGVVKGTRAAELPGPEVNSNDGFLDLFGRPPRESACECERSSGMSLGQALSLVNGPTISDAVRNPQNAIASLASVEKDPRRLVSELFYAILNRPAGTEELEQFSAALDTRVYENAVALGDSDHQALEARFAEWQEKNRAPIWQVLEPGILRSGSAAVLEKAADGAVLARGENPEKDNYTVIGYTPLAGITGVRLEALPDESLKNKGPGRADNGNFVLSEFRVAAASAGDPTQAIKVTLQNPSADFAQNGLPITQAIDGNPATGWGIADSFGAPHVAVFEAKEDFGYEGGTLITVHLDQQQGSKHTLGKFRLSVTTSKRPVRISGLPEEVLSILNLETSKRSPEHMALLFRHYIQTDAELADKIRLNAAQDLAWALINSPAFLFNH